MRLFQNYLMRNAHAGFSVVPDHGLLEVISVLGILGLVVDDRYCLVKIQLQGSERGYESPCNQ